MKNQATDSKRQTKLCQLIVFPCCSVVSVSHRVCVTVFLPHRECVLCDPGNAEQRVNSRTNQRRPLSIHLLSVSRSHPAGSSRLRLLIDDGADAVLCLVAGPRWQPGDEGPRRGERTRVWETEFISVFFYFLLVHLFSWLAFMKWSQVDIRSTANKMTNLNVFLTHDLVKNKKT